MKARVIKSDGLWYYVLNEKGERFTARLRGVFKKENMKVTNPVAVGDFVTCEVNEEDGTAVINEILSRQNYIIRKSTRKTEHAHVLASNLDQAVFIFSFKEPRVSIGFLDRFLVVAESFRIPVVIVFNKIDLLTSKDLEKLESYQKLYESIGYEVLKCSFETGENTKGLRGVFARKVTLVAGHSGVGKSTLLNFLNPQLNLKTQPISKFSKKGSHTTSSTEMIAMDDNTFIIDSPGIKELGLYDISVTEISHYFREMRALLGQCKFNNCIHVNEPGCAVLAAVEKGEISDRRYKSYLSLITNN